MSKLSKQSLDSVKLNLLNSSNQKNEFQGHLKGLPKVGYLLASKQAEHAGRHRFHMYLREGESVRYGNIEKIII